MSNENEPETRSLTRTIEEQASDGAVSASTSRATAEEDKVLIADATGSLPPHVVRDLLSIGVCFRCVLRLLGVHGHVYSCSSLSPSILCAVLEESKPNYGGVEESGLEPIDDSNVLQKALFCSVCMGILQFSNVDEGGVLVRRDGARELAASVAEFVKRDGHDIDGFAIDILIPSIVSANERAARLHMKKKYGSERWFKERLHNDSITVKDALRLSITNTLETLLGVESGVDSFQIRLTYTHTKASPNIPKFAEVNQPHKRRKTGMLGLYCTTDASSSIDEFQINGSEDSEHTSGAADSVIKKCLNSMQDKEFSEHFESPPTKVDRPCQLELHCHRAPIYIGGRYLKYSRNVSQTKWIIDDERMGEASVEEIIGSNILPVCRGDNYKFHAAGREDIDVRMLGSGRPFLLEVHNARCLPSMMPIDIMEKRINSLDSKLVRVKNLKMMGNQGWALMREGEAEKQKQYVALVWISHPIKEDDLQSLSSVKDMQILQKTPIRVLHRRSPLVREKIIHWMKVEKLDGSTQYFLLHLCTQAGTYIKEFVHGDFGRTHPSIGSMLGCRAEILQLDVTDVKMDCFN
ncbi:hypothetical protein Syun_005535 [Stephania yunnanensis]|uniref:tRNA pseudouridine(55) synthase n=1 Tax=Stephania yunnanensis TaxID=152371 RepID=A0AAP0Q2C5_9MAGN